MTGNDIWQLSFPLLCLFPTYLPEESILDPGKLHLNWRWWGPCLCKVYQKATQKGAQRLWHYCLRNKRPCLIFCQGSDCRILWVSWILLGRNLTFTLQPRDRGNLNSSDFVDLCTEVWARDVMVQGVCTAHRSQVTLACVFLSILAIHPFSHILKC